MRVKLFGLAAVTTLLFTAPGLAQDLVVDGTTTTLGGLHRYDQVRVINGGRIVVPQFDGTDRANTGNLVIVANDIFVDATSSISARGAGYGVLRCGDGMGPAADAGGAGGCAVRDSGGGGAHFGQGGRGTKDCNLFGSATSCQFPQEFESDCGNTLNGAGTACSSTADSAFAAAAPPAAKAKISRSTGPRLAAVSRIRAIREVFGENTPIVSSTKSLSGHSLGAAGAQEAIYSLLMMENNFIAKSANITNLDPAIEGVKIATEKQENTELTTVMSNSFGFGGTNATLVFKKYTG